MKDEKYLLEVGNRIRDRRKALGLTQRECADHFNVNRICQKTIDFAWFFEFRVA